MINFLSVIISEERDERYGKIEGTEWIWNGKNIGYGAAHNIGIRKSMRTGADYHLVINSDIEFQPEVISILSEYLETHRDVAQIMPKVLSPDGSNQHLLSVPHSCKNRFHGGNIL